MNARKIEARSTSDKVVNNAFLFQANLFPTATLLTNDSAVPTVNHCSRSKCGRLENELDHNSHSASYESSNGMAFENSSNQVNEKT